MVKEWHASLDDADKEDLQEQRAGDNQYHAQEKMYEK